MQLYLSWIGWCWVGFLAFWAVMALSVKKTKVREPFLNRTMYGVWLMISGLLLVQGQFPSDKTGRSNLFDFAAVPFGDKIFTPTAMTGLIGLILAILGLALAIWARTTLGRNWSGDVTIKKDHQLVTRGPYAFVRHPIYTAMLMMFVGTWLTLGNLGGIAGLAAMFYGFWVKLKKEEAFMRKTFPDQYPAYAKRVKRLIPWVF